MTNLDEIERLLAAATQGEDLSTNPRLIAALHNSAPDLIAAARRVKVLEAAITAYLATLGAEPVAWQWSGKTGNWYTIDSHVDRVTVDQHETRARELAALNGGTVRPLYAAPAKPGYVLVPEVPTKAMKDAVREAGGSQALAYGLAGWEIMLAAAKEA